MYYVDILQDHTQILASEPDDELRQRVEELFTVATRHKHEIDFTLRHWATPAERARVEDRLGSLMRISRQFHVQVHGHDEADPEPEPSPIA